MPASDSSTAPTLPGWVWTVLLTKFLLATSWRALYPYVPALSRATRSSEQQIAGTIASMQVNCMLSPLLAPLLATKMRYHTIMVTAIAVQAVTLAVMGLANSFPIFAFAIFMLGTGKGLLDPSSLTVIRQEIPAEGRSRVAAVMELSWGLCSGIGIPTTGLLMSVFWQLPFFVYSGLCAGAAIALFFTFRRTLVTGACVMEQEEEGAGKLADPAEAAPRSQAAQWSRLLRSGRARAVLLVAMAETFSMDLLMINFGAWLEGVHGLGLADIAKVTFIIGAADICAELIVLGALPRFRKPMTFVMYSVASLALSMALVPLLCSEAAGLPLGLAGLFLCFTATEATIVSNMVVSAYVEIPGCGEGFLESGGSSFKGLGRILGTLAGPMLYASGGLPVCGLAGAVICSAALLSYIMAFGCSAEGDSRPSDTS